MCWILMRRADTIVAMEIAGTVESVHVSPTHTMSKPVCASIRLIAGLGVEGDAHMGETVKHRSRVKADPTQPNLRQVHLIHGELIDGLRQSGFEVVPGKIGENVTTRGIDLLGLPTGALLRLGSEAVVRITGLRNPCLQLDGLQQGLMSAVLDRDSEGNVVRKAGIMGVVLHGGDVRPGDEIQVELPDGERTPLAPV
jgi:MOSC domain-containing protein YiiM